MNKYKLLTALLTALLITGCLPENEYKARGELYQCFIDGKAIYKSNVRPKQRGGNWFELNGSAIEVDDCYCMGCIGF